MNPIAGQFTSIEQVNDQYLNLPIYLLRTSYANNKAKRNYKVIQEFVFQNMHHKGSKQEIFSYRVNRAQDWKMVF